MIRLNPYKPVQKAKLLRGWPPSLRWRRTPKFRIAIQEDKCFKESSWMELGNCKAAAWRG